jgi:hypothetical protein
MIVILAVLAVINGCETRKYQVITRIEQDGGLYRSIEQPRDDTLPPEALVKPKSYPPSTQPADYALKPAWAARWSESQPATSPPADDEGKFIKAAGRFASAEDIPGNYHLIAWPLEDRASTNQINHKYEDFLLFGIDDWSERITDTVRLYEYVDTIDEMIRMMLPALEATMDELLGKEYDFKDLYEYVENEGPRIGRRFGLIVYQTNPEWRTLLTDREKTQQLKDLLSSVGFSLPLKEGGEEIDDEQAFEAGKEFLVNLCREKIRRRATGEHLTAEQAEKLLKMFGIDLAKSAESQPAGTTAPAAAAQTAPSTSPTTQEASPWDRAGDVFPGHFLRLTGREYEPMALLWAARMGGAHRNSPMGMLDPIPQTCDSREYTYRLEAAGPILETNGHRADEVGVVWTFNGSDLFPEGYRMHARAIRWNRPAEKKLYGREVLGDLATVLKLKELIGDRQPIRDGLQEAIERGSLEPIAKLSGSSDAAEAEAARAILALATRPSR